MLYCDVIYTPTDYRIDVKACVTESCRTKNHILEERDRVYTYVAKLCICDSIYFCPYRGGSVRSFSRELLYTTITLHYRRDESD